MPLNISVFDAHCDTISRCLANGEPLWTNSGMVSLESTSCTFENYCQVFSLYTDCAKPDHSTYGELLACFRRELSANGKSIAPCTGGAQAMSANRQGRAAAFLSVEGAELLDCDPDRLPQAAADGVILINLTWNHANALSGSCCEETERGLSPQGRRFLDRMGALRILADVSHLSEPGFWDVAEHSRLPVVASHSNAKAVWDHRRNLTDAQITAIIRSGGVIGLNFYRDFIGLGEDFDAVRAHLDHILELGGERTAALGGDWDGCDTIDALPDITALTKLYEYLLRCGYAESLLRRVFYQNLMDVVNKR